MPKTVLYDLASREPCQAWSLNPWKTRLALNYKGIDYETEWLEYPDLASTLGSYGVAPNDPKQEGYTRPYTIPAIRFEDGSYDMDSWKIALQLEKRYANPPLYLDSPVLPQVRDLLGKIFAPLLGVIIPPVPRNVLTPKSAEYYNRTRTEKFDTTLEEFEKDKGGDQAWEAAKGPIKEMADLLNQQEGPFFLGKTVSYADFFFVSFLEFLRKTDQEIFARFVSRDAGFLAIYEASRPWLEKQD